MPDGSEADLDMIRHPGAAAVVPIARTEAGEGLHGLEVVLIRQYRYAAGGYIHEIPAGVPDRDGESWRECARRELEEETGLTAAKLERLSSIHTTPGFTDEVIHIFVATGLTEGCARRDRHEYIEVVRLPLAEALRMVGSGAIRDAKSVAGILHFCALVAPGAAPGVPP